MKVRSLLILTAIVSSVLGAGAVYLALTVPNDLKADAMVKKAHRSLKAGQRDAARSELSRVIQEFPRTDAAAAATIALVMLGEQERKELAAQLSQLREQTGQQAQALKALQQGVETIRNTPPPVVEVAAPKPPPAKKAAPPRRRRHRR